MKLKGIKVLKMRIRVFRENRFLALRPIFYMAGMSKLIHEEITYHRMRSDHSFSQKIKIVGVTYRNP